MKLKAQYNRAKQKIEINRLKNLDVLMTSSLINNAPLINLISNIFVAFGTVSAVIVALWLSYRDNKPKLRVNAIVGIIVPDMTEYLWLTCVNIGKQSIICTSFAFTPNRFKKQRLSLIGIPTLPGTTLPKILQYSESINQYYSNQFFSDKTIKTMLSQYKFLAKIQLKYLWKITAHTNIQEFNGKLSNSLIEKIIATQFPNSLSQTSENNL